MLQNGRDLAFGTCVFSTHTKGRSCECLTVGLSFTPDATDDLSDTTDGLSDTSDDLSNTIDNGEFLDNLRVQDYLLGDVMV